MLPPKCRNRFSRCAVILCKATLFVFTVTISASAESVRFAVVSDTQGDPVNSYTYPLVIQQILKASPKVEFVIVAGDLVWGVDEYDTAMPEQFATWLKLTQPWYQSDMIGEKVYPIPGNHDARNASQLVPLWTSIFPDLPDNGPDCDKKMTYSFDAGPCHFVLLNEFCPGREYRVSDMDWFTSDLAASRQPIKLVFGHCPAYPFYRHIGSSMDMYPEERDAFWQVMVDQHVQAYFCGHEHEYDHWMKDGVHQLISGGLPGQFSFSQNYFIVDVDENDVTVGVYYALTGNLLTKFKLSDTADVPTDEHKGESVLKDASPFTCPGLFLITALSAVLSFKLLMKNNR